MHETALVQSIMDIVQEQLKANNLTRLTSLKLVVGEMSGAIPDALRFAFMANVAETEHKDAVLEIETVPALAKCRLCGKEFTYELGMSCPNCEGIAPKLIKGEELLIDYIDAE